MAKCSSCAAPLPPDSIRCEYCGCRNNVDLQGIHHYTTHESDEVRTCPRCGIALATIDLEVGGRFLIERCERCLGLFFDPGELEALLEATVTNVYSINRTRLQNITTSRPSDYGVSYVKCPTCSQIMNRINFGTRSGVIVDRCKDHGIWLDGGELRHLFEWMKAGGKLLHQERQEQLRKEQETAQEREKRKNSYLRQNAYGSGFDGYAGPLRDQDPDLFVIIRKALRLFT